MHAKRVLTTRYHLQVPLWCFLMLWQADFDWFQFPWQPSIIYECFLFFAAKHVHSTIVKLMFLSLMLVLSKTNIFQVLHKAMKGIGTNDTTLIRVIVTRTEIDMQFIRAEYRRKYGKSLNDAVHSETSSHYRNFLLSLLGPNHWYRGIRDCT